MQTICNRKECLINGISASREQSKHIKLYVVRTAVAAASATDCNDAEQSIIDETTEFSLIEFASEYINHTVRVEWNYITALCREYSKDDCYTNCSINYCIIKQTPHHIYKEYNAENYSQLRLLSFVEREISG